MATVVTTIQIRRGTSGQFSTNNPTLAVGELAFETNTGRLKIGDGFNDWVNLPYFAGVGGAPIDQAYADVTALIADQGAQTANFLYFVADATDDPRVGDNTPVYYEYLGSVTGDVSIDYRPNNIESFDWNRQIRKTPAVGEVPVPGVSPFTALSSGIEEIFYGTILTDQVIDNITIVQEGESSTPTLTGSVTANDGTISQIDIYEQDGTTFVTNVGITDANGFNPISEVLPAFVAAQADGRGYLIRVQVDYGSGVVTQDSVVLPVTVVFPILFGLASAGLNDTNLYTSLQLAITPQANQELTTLGAGPNRFYIAVPDEYSAPVGVKDNDGVELINSMLPATPAVIANVASSGLAANWTHDYKVYEGQYDVTFTVDNTHKLLFVGSTELGISTLDDILEGVTNKHLTAAEKAILQGLPTPIGDMLKSTYDSANDGVVDNAGRTAFVGVNNTLANIPLGRLVMVTGIAANLDVDIALASNVNQAMISVGVTAEAINIGQKGKVIISGTVVGVDTSSFGLGDLVYLDTNGMLTNVPPAPPAVTQIIGSVFVVGVMGAISVFPRRSWDLYPDIYPWGGSRIYKVADQVVVANLITELFGGVSTEDHPAILRSVNNHTSSDLVAEAANWDIVTGDMLSPVYDPNVVEGDVFDMDNMVEGATNKILTQAERDAIAAAQSPTTNITDTVNATPTVAETIVLPNDNSTYLINLTMTAMSSLQAEYGTWERRIACRQVGGTTTLMEFDSVHHSSPGSALNNNSISAAVNGSDEIEISVTGIAATNIRWTTSYLIVNQTQNP